MLRSLKATIVAATAFAGAGSAMAADISIAYINKLDDNAWFVREVAGARAAADEKGIDFIHQGVQNDSNKALSALEASIASGVDGVIIVVPDQEIGPAVLERADAAGIPVVAVDDGIMDADGNPAPFVGFEATAIGRQVGNAIADFHTELGWGEGISDDTVVLSVEVQGLSVCMDRNNNANEVLTERLGVTEDQIVHVPYDPGNLDVALSAVSQTIIGIPQANRFLIHACNDDGVLGAVRALEQANIPTDDMIGVGINGQLACEEFRKPNQTGLRASVYVDSAVHGSTAVEILYANLTEGVELPARTIIDGTLITRDDTKGVPDCQ